MSETKTAKLETTADQLPRDWAKALGARPGEKVRVRLETLNPDRRIDQAAIDRFEAELEDLEVIDHRTADEILGYDELGLPS